MARRTPRQPSVQGIREAYEAPGTVENPKAMSIVKAAGRKKILRFCLFATVFVIAPLALLGLLSQAVNATEGGKGNEIASSVAVNESEGKAAAQLELAKWLALKPAPLPGGSIISWDGFTTEKAPKAPEGSNEVQPEYTQETHHFTLQGKDGAVYDTQVQVLVDGTGAVKPSGTPTLLPRPVELPGDFRGETTWFGFTGKQADDSITTAVDTWADALVSGSPKTLKQIVGDPEPTRSYVPMTGVAKVSAQIMESGIPAPKDPTKEEPAPNWMISRVELTFTWAGVPKPDGVTSDPAKVSYDLLITGTNTATPTVVSWGGVGSGPSLKKYSVALKGVQLAEPSATDSTAEETPVPAPTTAPKKKGGK